MKILKMRWFIFLNSDYCRTTLNLKRKTSCCRSRSPISEQPRYLFVSVVVVVVVLLLLLLLLLLGVVVVVAVVKKLLLLLLSTRSRDTRECDYGDLHELKCTRPDKWQIKENIKFISRLNWSIFVPFSALNIEKFWNPDEF